MSQYGPAVVVVLNLWLGPVAGGQPSGVAWGDFEVRDGALHQTHRAKTFGNDTTPVHPRSYTHRYSHSTNLPFLSSLSQALVVVAAV